MIHKEFSRSRSLGKYFKIIGIAFFLSAGCVGQGKQIEEDSSDRDREPRWTKKPALPRTTQPEPRRVHLGSSVQGRPLEYVSLGHGSDCVFILATIHGDEDAGTGLVHELADYLLEHPGLIEGRRIVLMPNANPDGMANQTRGNANGVDLNRNFPASNFSGSERHGTSALSEPESVAIERILKEHRPRRIVSIHQPLRYGNACIDHDGPAHDLALAMARHTDIPAKKIGSRPGSLGSYAGLTLETPIITLELPKRAKGMDRTTLWRLYGDMLLAAITYPEPLQTSAAYFAD